MTPEQHLAEVRSLLDKNGDPEISEGQVRYLRNQYEFYGIKSGLLKELIRDLFQQHGTFRGNELKRFVRLCMEDDHREVHYYALFMVEKQVKKLPEDDIRFLEELIMSNSWWDTVDWVRKFVGIHFNRFPHLIRPVTEKWMDSGNIWLQRICLIFQLSYKENTDFELMSTYIKRLASSREFFIRKGAGWALRQYSKTNPAAVTDFVDQNPDLPPLTKREAMKWLNRNA